MYTLHSRIIYNSALNVFNVFSEEKPEKPFWTPVTAGTKIALSVERSSEKTPKITRASNKCLTG